MLKNESFEERLNRITMDESIGGASDPTVTVTESKLPAFYDKVEEKAKTLQELIDECFMVPGSGLVIVMPDKFEYKGKLTLPKTAERNGTTGIILKVGDLLIRTFNFEILKPGDRIAYGQWVGTQFSFQGRPSYRVLGEAEVTCIVKDPKAELLDVGA
jgi:co-chaperonin GroES (HSP10)